MTVAVAAVVAVPVPVCLCVCVVHVRLSPHVSRYMRWWYVCVFMCQYDVWRRHRDEKPPVTFEIPVFKHGHYRKQPQRRMLALTGSTVLELDESGQRTFGTRHIGDILCLVRHDTTPALFSIQANDGSVRTYSAVASAMCVQPHPDAPRTYRVLTDEEGGGSEPTSSSGQDGTGAAAAAAAAGGAGAGAGAGAGGGSANTHSEASSSGGAGELRVWLWLCFCGCVAVWLCG